MRCVVLVIVGTRELAASGSLLGSRFRRPIPRRHEERLLPNVQPRFVELGRTGLQPTKTWVVLPVETNNINSAADKASPQTALQKSGSAAGIPGRPEDAPSTPGQGRRDDVVLGTELVRAGRNPVVLQPGMICLVVSVVLLAVCVAFCCPLLYYSGNCCVCCAMGCQRRTMLTNKSRAQRYAFALQGEWLVAETEPAVACCALCIGPVARVVNVVDRKVFYSGMDLTGEEQYLSSCLLGDRGVPADRLGESLLSSRRASKMLSSKRSMLGTSSLAKSRLSRSSSITVAVGGIFNYSRRLVFSATRDGTDGRVYIDDYGTWCRAEALELERYRHAVRFAQSAAGSGNGSGIFRFLASGELDFVIPSL